MASVTKNNMTVVYETHGDRSGEPLLLLMGLGGQLTDWPPGFIDELIGQGFWVITPDNRDQGLSTECSGAPPKPRQLLASILFRRPLPHAYLLSDMADDHLMVLDDLGVKAAHVGGMSMGGMLAQEFAIRHPNRTLSLTSIMSTTGNPKVGRPKFKVMLRFMRDRNLDQSKALEESVRTFRLIAGPAFDEADFRQRSAASIQRSFRPIGTARQLGAILASGDRTAQLKQVGLPTLVIHGSVDPLVTPSGGVATAEAVRGSRLLMFPEMGHYLPAGRWHEMATAIRGLVARSTTQSTTVA